MSSAVNSRAIGFTPTHRDTLQTKKSSEPFDSELWGEIETILVALDIQELIQNRAQNIRSTVVICSVLVFACVAVLVLAV